MIERYFKMICNGCKKPLLNYPAPSLDDLCTVADECGWDYSDDLTRATCDTCKGK